MVRLSRFLRYIYYLVPTNSQYAMYGKTASAQAFKGLGGGWGGKLHRIGVLKGYPTIFHKS